MNPQSLKLQNANIQQFRIMFYMLKFIGTYQVSYISIYGSKAWPSHLDSVFNDGTILLPVNHHHGLYDVVFTPRLILQ